MTHTHEARLSSRRRILGLFYKAAPKTGTWELELELELARAGWRSSSALGGGALTEK